MPRSGSIFLARFARRGHSMRIYRFINRVPGGLMVVPLFIGMAINTFFPTLLQIGGFTQALSGAGYPTMLGMYLFTVGTKMTMRAAPYCPERRPTSSTTLFTLGSYCSLTVLPSTVLVTDLYNESLFG